MTLPEEKLYEINIIDFLYTLLVNRKFILYFVSIVNIVTVLIVLIVPRYFEGRVTVMPSKQKNQFSASALLKNALPLGGLGLSKTSEELLTYTTILNSRSSFEQLIFNFHLMKEYNEKTVEQTIKELQSRVDFSVNSDETALEIKVLDPDSSKAREMAGFFVSILNNIYIELNTSEAKSNREFIQKRYYQTLDTLSKAENELRRFQEKYGLYTATEQIKVTISAAAQLKSEIVMKDIEIGVMENSMAKSNPEIEKLRVERAAIQEQLKKLESNDKKSIFIPLTMIPERGLEYLRLMREVEIQSKIQETLLPLFEQAKIEENRDTPTVIILDQPSVSYRPVKPKRMIIVLVVFIVSIFVSIFVVFIIEFFKKIRNETIGSDNDVKLSYIFKVIRPKEFFNF